MEGRLVDIPYLSSPPLLFTFTETANVALGVYTFSSAKTTFTPSRPIQANVLYMFDTMDFAVDILEGDYFGAITTLPQFSMYLQSDASGPAFREPIVLSKYFNRLPYKLAVMGSELLGASDQPATQGFQNNRLLGDVSGVLNQTPALLGKLSITAILVFTVQEISDHQFIEDFKQRGGARNAHRTHGARTF